MGVHIGEGDDAVVGVIELHGIGVHRGDAADRIDILRAGRCIEDGEPIVIGVIHRRRPNFGTIQKVQVVMIHDRHVGLRGQNGPERAAINALEEGIIASHTRRHASGNLRNIPPESPEHGAIVA